MALELRQQIKLSQQLVMTPQLQQAIKLLQLSRLELVETVQRELLENPFLEERDDANDFGERPEAADLAEVRKDQPESQEVRPEQTSPDDAYDKDASREADWEDYLGEFASTSRTSQARETDLGDDMTPFEARYASRPSLEGHLLWQLRLSSLSEEQKDIGEVIIGNLAPSGYLQASDEEIAAMAGCEPEQVAPVLEVIHYFDPVGVGARNASECLCIQLRQLRYDRDPVLMGLVNEHLADIENKQYKPLLRKYSLTLEDLKEYLQIIQSLDPLPGASFGEGEPTYVSPDVFVYKVDDEFVIVLNDDGLPQLQLSALCAMSLEGGSDKDREYCSDKKRSAEWLIKSLYQRNRTLYKVVESIIKHQRPFFEQGVTQLSPLILKDIAEDIGMHESTVSRITTNKYVATPHGIFELKFFFNSALELDDGSQVGSESVKALIKKFIAEEDPKNPLSDEKIGEMLKEHLKVNIARRTVAKYRTAMDIASSSRRREHF